MVKVYRSIKMHPPILLSVAIIVTGFIDFLMAEEFYTLNTGIGNILGRIEKVGEESEQLTVTQFLGIPYAEPPVGNLRFQKPVAKPPFSSVYNATQPGVACAQSTYGPPLDTSTEKSEDCLLLNVYVPFNMSTGNQGNLKPVMIWIYGGRFIRGESNSYDGSLLSTFGDVIVVTINYRLAFFGFLTSGEAVLPGNLGLWDQHLAIKWVYNNIQSFGGDPGKVTIFGESAGSASVVYQCMYPGNLGLFHNAIAQSGSFSSVWAFYNSQVASRNFDFLAQRFGCTQPSSADKLGCLKQVPSDQLSAILDAPIPLTPVDDGDFVLDLPANIISGTSTANGVYEMFRSVNLMIGYTNADGLVDVPGSMRVLNVTDINEFVLQKRDLEDVLIPYYQGRFLQLEENNKAVQLATINEYTDWRNPNSDVLRGQMYTDFLTDALFVVPTALAANLHANLTVSTTSTYVYEFAVRPIEHIYPVPPSLDGIDVMNHGDDIVFVFGQDLNKAMADPQYAYLVDVYRATMTLWTNFAKSGNPNSPVDVSTLINSTWPEYSSSKEYIKLTAGMSPESVKANPRPQAVNFWNNILPTLVEANIPNNLSRDDTTVTVTTPIGEITGVESYVPYSEDCGFRIQKYLGIPFAKAATGSLRFQKPVAREPFTVPFNATMFGPRCYQPAFPGETFTNSEDCLLLNVFVPTTMISQGTSKPVFIWIHGDGFAKGQSNTYDPQVLSGYGDVIVVTINYRISYYGFMTTGDTVIPSNIGLWDQHMAIKWVHDNIAAFGGDNNRITIFGQSAGSASVVYQTFYPGNKGLFQRAIAHSGTSESTWAYADLPTSITYTQEFAERSGCSLSTSSVFLECLQSKSIEELQTAVNSIQFGLNTLPTRDNDFILDTPGNILSGRSTAREAVDMFHSVDLIVGFTNADGVSAAPIWQQALSQTDFNRLTVSRSNYEQILVPSLSRITDMSDHAINTVIHEYTDWSNPESEAKRAQVLVDLYTDSSYATTSVRAADLHAMSPANRKTYLYEFSVRPLQHRLPVPALFDGPGIMNHGDDIAFVMGTDITVVSDSDEHHQQLRVYQAAMTMWSNFAKTGNPNSPTDITKYIYTTWPQYTSSRQYLDITQEVTQGAAKQHPRLRALNFWSVILPETDRMSQMFGSCDTSSANSSQVQGGVLISFLFFVTVFNIM